MLGILLGLGGVGLLVAPGEFIGGRHADLLGAAAITLGALGWAAGSVTSHARPLHSSPQLSTGVTMIAGGTLMVVVGLLVGEGAALGTVVLTPKLVFAWLYLITFGSLLGFSAFIFLLRVSTPQKVSTSAFVNPLVAVLLGWMILGESVTPRTVLAGAVILGAVILIRARKLPGFSRAEPPQPAGRKLP
jgi:drug/metabolite transporter (DMT)-like permease